MSNRKKVGAKPIMSEAILADQIRIEDELSKIITKIVDDILAQEKSILKDLQGSDYAFLEDSISKFAWQAELKIQIKQVRETKARVLKILKASTNRMILATIEVAERIN